MTILVSQPLVDRRQQVFISTNLDSVALVAGTPVTRFSGGVRRASSSLTARAITIGLVLAFAGPTLPVRVVSSGELTLSAAQWDVITGGVGGLVADATYYLDTILGGITTTPPTIVGLSLVELGTALTTTSMLFDPRSPILL